MKSCCPDAQAPGISGLLGSSIKLGLLGFTVLLGGCIVIPTREHDSGDARSNINQDSPSKIQSGVSTLVDVLLTFGEPDAASWNGLKLVYRSQKNVAYWIAAGGYSAAGGALTKDYYFVIEFDEQGVVRQREFSSRWLLPAVPEKLLETKRWVEANEAAAGMTARISGRAFRLPNADGFQIVALDPLLSLEGYMVLTDQTLEFRDHTQLANEAPCWRIGYETMTNCQLKKLFRHVRVVIRTIAGEDHSFHFVSRNGMLVDGKKTEAACEFIKARIRELDAARTN